ncbi:lactonase family protein [Pseudomonas sp. MAFF212428]|uniref:Lactonase family protein n=1 Tax=Pseudomonas brassicae TaxID=2708063 RepID=A0A6M0CZH3_9PSED|nr:lactonase family protein [Pseudomonas brassicae]
MYADGTLSGFSDYVTSIRLSDDGKTLLIVANSASNSAGTSYLRVYARDPANGQLSLLQSFTQGASDDPSTTVIEVDGLKTISTVSVSGDGTSVYVAGFTASQADGTLVHFQRDAGTGLLSDASIVALNGANGVTGLDGQVNQIVVSATAKASTPSTA